MYIIRDPLTPAIKSHADALAFKNTMLRHFPFGGRLILWHKGQGVYKDNAHRRIYHQLGMSIKDMEHQKYKGVKYTYLYLKPYSAPNGVITKDDIRNYMFEYSPLIYPNSKDPFNSDPLADTNLNPDPNKGTANAYWDKDGWITVVLTYTPTEINLVDNSISDSAILQKVRDISPNEIFFDPHKNSRLTALAMLDLKTNAVFQTQLRIQSKSVVNKPNNILGLNTNIRGSSNKQLQIKYVKSAYIELKFRRIVDIQHGHSISSNVDTWIGSVEKQIEDLYTYINTKKVTIGTRYSIVSLTSINSAKTVTKSVHTSVNQQLTIMANWAIPYIDDEMTLVADESVRNAYYASEDEVTIKKDGLASLPPKQFQKVFSGLVKFGYHDDNSGGHWYDAVVSIVIAVVAVAAAVLSGGWGGAAIALALGAAAEGVWAMYLAKNGGGAGAIHTTLGISEILGIAALVAGITALYNQWQQKMTLELAQKEAESQMVAAVENGASQEAIDASANTFIQAYEANAATSSIVSMVGQGIGDAMQVGQKLGLIDGDQASMVSNIASVGTGTYDFLGSSEATLSSLQSIADIGESIKNGVTKFFNKPLGDILNQTLNWINSAFNIYVNYISPPNEGLADKQAQLEKLEKEVQDTNPDNIDNTWTAYTDPYGSVFEVGDQYDKTYIMLTSGSIRSMMNKSYDSGWKI